MFTTTKIIINNELVEDRSNKDTVSSNSSSKAGLIASILAPTGILGLIGFMSIFVKICSVHTPSSNPRLKPARSLSLKRGVCQLFI